MINATIHIDISKSHTPQHFEWEVGDNINTPMEMMEEGAFCISLLNKYESGIYDHLASCTGLDRKLVVEMMAPLIVIANDCNKETKEVEKTNESDTKED